MAATDEASDTRHSGRFTRARRLIEMWALGGGLVLVAVILMNVWSVAAGALTGRPLPGDFEMVEMGVAVAAFAFLPYCTLTGGHVSADVFTEHAGPLTKALLAVAAGMAGVAIGGVLVWRMGLGLSDQISYGETTSILGIPLWWAYVPIVASLALMVIAALVSLIDAIDALRARPH